MEIIYRDDDANVYTCCTMFKESHEKFISAKQTHTAAVLMKDLWNNHALFWYLINAPYMSVQLHGWEHKDYSKLSYDECYGDLKKSVEYWNTNATRMMSKPAPKINTFFAPWNHSSPTIKKACADLGLKFCDVSSPNTLTSSQWDGRELVSFHWWNCMDNNFHLKGIF